MDTGVGPPGSGNPHGAIRQPPEHALQLALDGPGVGLSLPAGEVGPVVLHGQQKRASGHEVKKLTCSSTVT
jgi:hypothetical protein